MTASKARQKDPAVQTSSVAARARQELASSDSDEFDEDDAPNQRSHAWVDNEDEDEAALQAELLLDKEDDTYLQAFLKRGDDGTVLVHVPTSGLVPRVSLDTRHRLARKFLDDEVWPLPTPVHLVWWQASAQIRREVTAKTTPQVVDQILKKLAEDVFKPATYITSDVTVAIYYRHPSDAAAKDRPIYRQRSYTIDTRLVYCRSSPDTAAYAHRANLALRVKASPIKARAAKGRSVAGTVHPCDAEDVIFEGYANGVMPDVRWDEPDAGVIERTQAAEARLQAFFKWEDGSLRVSREPASSSPSAYCVACGRTSTPTGDALLRCSRCKVRYCCEDHWKRDWVTHKRECKVAEA